MGNNLSSKNELLLRNVIICYKYTTKLFVRLVSTTQDTTYAFPRHLSIKLQITSNQLLQSFHGVHFEQKPLTLLCLLPYNFFSPKYITSGAQILTMCQAPTSGSKCRLAHIGFSILSGMPGWACMLLFHWSVGQRRTFF